MDYWLIIAGVIAIIMIVIIVVWFFGGSGSAPSQHSIFYAGQPITFSATPIPNTSDGIQTIFYAMPTGIYTFDKKDKNTALYSDLQATGLAYSGGLLAIDADGNLYNFAVSSTEPVEKGFTGLYSTDKGFAFNRGNGWEYRGSQVPANGNFGMVQYTVK